ncbi:tyrosine-type recombinase/integrase [Neptunomonas antarctica]|uniref:tyrosine-type recombinase/integrase n=1 Tax=Neptunomonas antarctica TaxID=619304 RepID=UPI00097078DA
MNGGNIVTLQRILGHSSVKTTMRYVHLCPDFLNAAIKFNQMSGISGLSSMTFAKAVFLYYISMGCKPSRSL